MNIDMTMFHQAFFEEANDILTNFEAHLLTLEDTPDDVELLNSIFRCAHSIKGGGAMFGFTDLANFTHGLETLLDNVRTQKVPVTRVLVELLLESLDQMKALIAVARGDANSAPNAASLMHRIEAASVNALDEPVQPNRELKTVDVESAARDCMICIKPGKDTLRHGIDPVRLITQLLESGEKIYIECDESKIPKLHDLDPETCYLNWFIALHTDKTDAELLEIFEFIADDSEISIEHIIPNSSAPNINLSLTEAKPQPVYSGQSTALKQPTNSTTTVEAQTLRVATEKVDKLINLVGELVINQSMLNEVIQDFSMAKLPHLIDAVAAMERASRELQERVMAIRMLPIKHAFGRFPRLVHDLSATVGKKIELKTSGEDTELDKGIIEAIADPLTHLVRNSIDHGLETPDERRAAGKPETGIVSLDAYHEGGNIVVEVSDDGRGLNRDRILTKARERGWVAENETPSDETIYNYVFQPGFSTASVVTDISGRGVGMDIVKQGIQALGGSINLKSDPGKGACFRIRLPLTMAILEGLSMAVGDEIYILPLTSIIESIQPKPKDVRRILGNSDVVTVRDSVLPILRLYELFETPPRITDPCKGLLVIVENDRRKAALFVDELIGQSQVVIKSLEANYRKVNGIAGATIMGNGKVALIIDVPSLLRDCTESSTLESTKAA